MIQRSGEFSPFQRGPMQTIEQFGQRDDVRAGRNYEFRPAFFSLIGRALFLDYEVPVV